MCGRYTVRIPEGTRDVLGAQPPAEPVLRFNMSPNQTAPVVTMASGSRVCQDMRWAFRPSWFKKPRPPINARAETVFLKPMFKASALRHRCLVPVSGWYEWPESPAPKRPHLIQRKDEALFAFAGIWTHGESASWEPTLSYAILTTDASPFLSAVHRAMPVIVSPAHWEGWLDPAITEGGITVLSSILDHHNDDELEYFQVDTYVNKPGHDDPRCILPMNASGIE